MVLPSFVVPTTWIGFVGVDVPIPTLVLVPVYPLIPFIAPRINELSCCEYAYAPITVRFTPAELFTFALYPIAVHEFPVISVDSVPLPIAIFPFPVPPAFKFAKAPDPIAILSVSAELNGSELYPIATLFVPVAPVALSAVPAK